MKDHSTMRVNNLIVETLTPNIEYSQNILNELD